MHATSTARATTTSVSRTGRTPAPTRRPRRWGRVGRAVRPVAIGAAAMAAIALTGAINGPAVTLTAAEGLELAPGIAVTPAPGWTIGNQGPGWVTLHNAFSTAELEIKVKPSNGTDPVAVLQGDINSLSNFSTTGLINVSAAPTANPVQSGNFQQQVSINFSADGASRSGPLPVTGWFSELLNTSTHQSAFVVFDQNGDAPIRADGDATATLDSLL